jgi:ribosomal protein S18 acetylase RimI-like enzyme
LTLAELLKRQDRTQAHPSIPDNSRIYVATVAERIAGMVVCHQPSDGIMPISNLFVLEQYRRQGIGTALLQSAISYADKNEIRLSVNRRNTAARRIYRKLGFRLSDNVDLRLRPCRYN